MTIYIYIFLFINHSYSKSYIVLSFDLMRKVGKTERSLLHDRNETIILVEVSQIE